MQAEDAGPVDLNAAAMRAMAARDIAAARSLFERAVALAPDYVPAWLNLAGARRARGDLPGAPDAVEQVLRVEPRAFLGHLMKASLLERAGEARSTGTRTALDHAAVVRARHQQELERSLRARILSADPAEPHATRVLAFLNTYLGKRRISRRGPVE